MLMGCDHKFNVHYGWEGGKSPPPLDLQVGGKSPWGEKSPPIWHCEGGEKSPPRGRFPSPLKIFLRKVRKLFLHALHINLTLTQHFLYHIS